MVQSANIQQIKDMLTICCPDPNGNINIQGENLKRIMTMMGFEFLIMMDNEVDQVRTALEALEPAGQQVVKIDEFATYLNDYVEECTDASALTEAFKQFDADGDDKLSIEEFKFFMTSFAKDMNGL